MWCELALSLGDTIGGLQGKMTHREFDIWCQYRNKYGSLNPVRKYDQGHALVAAMINNAHGGKAKPKDFIPYGKQDDVVDNDTFLNLLEGSKGVKVVKVGR